MEDPLSSQAWLEFLNRFDTMLLLCSIRVWNTQRFEEMFKGVTNTPNMSQTLMFEAFSHERCQIIRYVVGPQIVSELRDVQLSGKPNELLQRPVDEMVATRFGDVLRSMFTLFQV